MKSKVLSIFIILILFISPTFSQEHKLDDFLYFETFSNDDGLSHNNIKCIFQDSKGFLWIGTTSGLNRFDGKNFVTFRSDPLNKKTISSNNILGICEDKNQNIWVATEFGLNQLIRETLEFNRYFVDTTQNYHLEKNIIHNVLCDNEGNIWVKTRKNISKLNIKTGKIQSYQLYSDIFNEEFEQYSYPLFQDSNGILWVGTDNGLGYYEPHNDDFIFFRHYDFISNTISDNKILSIFEDSKHNLWIGTRNGLNQFDKKNKKFYSYYYPQQTQSIVNGIAEGYRPEELWITTESNGLYYFNTNSKKFIHCAHTSQRQGISTNQTNCITRSTGKILWIGTQNGLNKLDIKPKRFQVLGKEDGNFGIKYNYTTAIHVEKNHVFFGTKFGGLQIYDLSRHTKESYSADKGNFPTNYITAIESFSPNEILVGSDGYIHIYNIDTKKFSSIDERITALHSFCLTKKRIKCLLKDSKNNLWIGTNFGIIFYDQAKDSVVHIDGSKLPSNLINCFYENYKNNIFIGCENGFCYFDHKTQKFTPIKLDHNFINGTHQHIYDIAEDYNGDIWIGTNVGLIKCTQPNYQPRMFYTTNEGLISNEIYSILTNDNEIWVGTDNGLASFLPDSNICKTFSIHDGIQDSEFSPHSAFKTNNGYMFFGGTQGINIFNPDSIKNNLQNTNLEFLNLEYTLKDKRYSLPLKDKQEITMPWNNSNISISFAALEYTQPKMNQYKYMLSGLEDKWIELNNQNYINIIKLPIGNYTLKVKAANVDGVWSEEKYITIIIKPPFWRTDLAYVLGILLLIAIIFFIGHRITVKLRRENRRLLEKQVWADRLEKQQAELEVKNKSILDSINYAKRIQLAILPARAKFKQLLPSSFILYMPKDIVSGDFYWIREIGDKLFVVCSDCTGHGVPGAFMSIIGNNLLRIATKNRGIHRASEILDYLNKSIIELFTKNELDDDSAVKDGMDISICVFDKKTGVLEFAGALTRMILVRNNQVIIYRGDKSPVGLCNEQDDLYTNTIIRVQPNDRFYLFSDGYADQFGGENGKKMKFKHFKHNILTVQHVPMMKQGNELRKLFQQWQGKWEQVDDVIVMGFDFNKYIEEINSKEKTSL